MHAISTKNNLCTFALEGKDPSIANAIRRSLMQSVPSFAPSEVSFEINTSCQTDEYIAHRIGLVPFRAIRQDLEDKDMVCEIDVSDRTIMSSDVVGPFTSPFATEIMKLMEGQQVKATIKFEKSTGERHARFSPVAAVGYNDETADNNIHMRFESINGEHPVSHLEAALQALVERLYDVKYQVELSSSKS